MKKIWIFNHYGTNQFLEHGGRHINFAKNLIKQGYEPTIFVASSLHNSDINLIQDNTLFSRDSSEKVPFVFVKTDSYTGNGTSRIKNMFQYYFRLFKVTMNFEKPDVIIGSSVHPLACVAAIKMAKKYKCKCVVEIRDLWPESIVVYKGISKKNPIIWLLYKLEKWIYKNADQLIFTMEGGKDYIVGNGWDKEHGGDIDINKVHHINNGVDLDIFNYNKKKYTLNDVDLDDEHTFKVIYTGSVRLVNNISMLVDTASYMQSNGYTGIKILIYGDGDEKEILQKRCSDEKIENIVFKGQVDKKFIPYILSRSDLNLIHVRQTDIMKYGCSLNKLFEYLASGKPILSSLIVGYDLLEKYNCGVTLKNITPQAISSVILKIYNATKEELDDMSNNALEAAKDYDFKKLTEKLICIIESRDISHRKN
ncbi:glycosyltransferase family 4 protein [Clostridium sp.]|uniref:glycosyltransferase family 4 protein n=1 Tax=Clostridium sp. TaxID=1506 RepID=UPI003D6CD8F5